MTKAVVVLAVALVVVLAVARIVPVVLAVAIVGVLVRVAFLLLISKTLYT